MANTALRIQKHFFSLVKFDMPNTLLCLEKAHPSHVGWASWLKAQSQKHDFAYDMLQDHSSLLFFCFPSPYMSNKLLKKLGTL